MTPETMNKMRFSRRSAFSNSDRRSAVLSSTALTSVQSLSLAALSIRRPRLPVETSKGGGVS